MTRNTRSRRPVNLNRLALAVAAAGMSVVLANCSATGDGDSTSGPNPQEEKAVPSLNAKLPDSIRERGWVRVATDTTFPPMSYYKNNNKDIIGIDPDIGHALGGALGIEFRFTNVSFDGIIPGLQSGRYDLAMADMVATKERQKTVDFVTYMNAGDGLLVQKGNPQKISDLNSLCGHTVALAKGTYSVTIVNAQAKKCDKQHKAKLTTKLYPLSTSAKQALAQGRVDAYMDDVTSTAYAEKQSPDKFQTVPGTYASAPVGAAFPKDSKKLRSAVTAALKHIMAKGPYKDIFKKWGISKLAIDQPVFNPPSQ